MKQKTQKRLIIGGIGFTLWATYYSVYHGPTLDAPIWYNVLFGILQGVFTYFSMRWAVKKFSTEKTGTHPKPKQKDKG